MALSKRVYGFVYYHRWLGLTWLQNQIRNPEYLLLCQTLLQIDPAYRIHAMELSLAPQGAREAE